MFSKKKNTSKLDLEQRELYENARRRTLQKKRLFQHFVIFLVGAVLLIILNVVIGYKEEFMPLGYNWFVWAILLWTFFFLIHLINVLVTSSLMGKEWEQRHMERLVKKQRDRIREMELQVEQEHPLPSKNKTNPQPIRIREDNSGNPDKPLNH